MQEYVPAGNGDASGEYANEEGSNRNFTSFKKPKEGNEKKIYTHKRFGEGEILEQNAVFATVKFPDKTREINLQTGLVQKKSFSQFVKERKEKDKEFYFSGGTTQKSNKYFHYKHFLNDNEVIVNTSNIKYINGNPVLVVGRNKGLYLKDWQLKPFKNYDKGIEGYTVKLNRNYFKPYTFRFDFNDINIENDETFDDFINTAKAQDKEDMPISLGHFNY